MTKTPRGFTPEMRKEIVEIITASVEEAFGKERERMASLAAQYAIKAYHDEGVKERKLIYDSKLRNTKLLLQNYREMKAHSDSAIYNAAQVCNEDVYDILEMMTGNSDGNGVQVESIKKSVGRTRVIIEHIQEMLRIYEVSCERSQKPEDMRRLRTIKRLYLEDEVWSIEQISDDEGIDVSTVYKDLKDGTRRLTALIFGVDGLRK